MVQLTPIIFFRASVAPTLPCILALGMLISKSALMTALEVLAANGVETVIQNDQGTLPTPVISHAILPTTAKVATRQMVL